MKVTYYILRVIDISHLAKRVFDVEADGMTYRDRSDRFDMFCFFPADFGAERLFRKDPSSQITDLADFVDL